MTDSATVRSAVVDALYKAAAARARRATDYFDWHARFGPKLHGRAEQAAAAREWLKLSERLLRVIAWMLPWRQPLSREEPSTIPPPPTSNSADVKLLPATARELIDESADLYA